jgi:hypothetical protein
VAVLNWSVLNWLKVAKKVANMAGAMFGYVLYMAAALSILMVLLSGVMGPIAASFMGPSPVKEARTHSHHSFAITQNTSPEQTVARSVATTAQQLPDDSVAKNVSDQPKRSATQVEAEAEKSRRLRIARYRRQAIARLREQRNYSASQYAQEPWYGSPLSHSQSE